MSLKEFIPIAIGVITDWRVIVTLVLMIIVMGFTNYIMHYKKKTKVPKAKKIKEEKSTEEKKTEEKKADEKSAE